MIVSFVMFIDKDFKKQFDKCCNRCTTRYEWNYSKKSKLVFKRCFAWFDSSKGWFHELGFMQILSKGS